MADHRSNQHEQIPDHESVPMLNSNHNRSSEGIAPTERSYQAAVVVHNDHNQNDGDSNGHAVHQEQDGAISRSNKKLGGLLVGAATLMVLVLTSSHGTGIDRLSPSRRDGGESIVPSSPVAILQESLATTTASDTATATSSSLEIKTTQTKKDASSGGTKLYKLDAATAAKEGRKRGVYTDEALSSKSPKELGLSTFSDRAAWSRPQDVFGSVQGGAANGTPLPTNEWFLNLVIGLKEKNQDFDDDDEHFVGLENRVYTIPYIVDTVGPIVGTRLHYPHTLCWGTGVQSSFVDRHGLTLGTLFNKEDHKGFTRRYKVDEETLPNKLGVGLRWKSEKDPMMHMRSSILRGMPYGTMQYGPGVMPVIASEITNAGPPLIDSSHELECGKLNALTGTIDTNSTSPPSFLVKQDIEVSFAESDFTWLVFFSRPVKVQCYVNPRSNEQGISYPPGAIPPESAKKDRNAFQIRLAKEELLNEKEEPLIVRIALANNCTMGTNPNYCVRNKARDQSEFSSILRGHADVYPSDPKVTHAYSSELLPDPGATTSAFLYFDWGARSIRQDVLDFGADVHENAFKSHTWPATHGNTTSPRWFASPPLLGAPLAESKPTFKTQTADVAPVKKKKELLMYALSHHMDIMRPFGTESSNEVIESQCTPSLHGPVCLVKGGLWAMEEDLGENAPSFTAARLPNHRGISALAKATLQDIHYSLPDNYMRGAGDTYFSGKMLAKLARILVITDELKDLKKKPTTDNIDSSTDEGKEMARVMQKVSEVEVPTDHDFDMALERLKQGVEVWLNGTASSIYVFDDAWGGLVNCGCLFDSWTQDCDNAYPNCPSFSDPGLNFGNGFYNDHHFHYGYHIYAAAVVAKYDQMWGREYFERVLLYIRDIANPSIKDAHFPAFRQKDWYLGNSWASGIATIGGRPYSNGRNQESSSEAIAAYEGIAMYGHVMVSAFGSDRSSSPKDNVNSHTASRVRDLGRLLTATELRSADRYWHVWHGNEHKNLYPDSYHPAVVGMMWDTMAQFQTWFGNAPFLAYGIQLLPLTPISEQRDNVQWCRQLYDSFSKSCESNKMCTEQGWSISVYAILATVGHRELALKKALDLDDDVFESAGGSGHSLTNTLWYISTRPEVEVPFNLDDPSTTLDSKNVTHVSTGKEKELDCGCPTTCTSKVLEKHAGQFTCRERMEWLVTNRGMNELGACRHVAAKEYPSQCGDCDPASCAASGYDLSDHEAEDDDFVDDHSKECPPCSSETCDSSLNLCPVVTAPYLCTGGPSIGGCSPSPWETSTGGFCLTCCQVYEGCKSS